MTNCYAEAVHILGTQHYHCTQITTKYQIVEVFCHPYFGNILVIDQSLQITERDEANYHEMMAHVPLVYMPDAKKVCVQRQAIAAMPSTSQQFASGGAHHVCDALKSLEPSHPNAPLAV